MLAFSLIPRLTVILLKIILFQNFSEIILEARYKFSFDRAEWNGMELKLLSWSTFHSSRLGKRLKNNRNDHFPIFFLQISLFHPTKEGMDIALFIF